MTLARGLAPVCGLDRANKTLLRPMEAALVGPRSRWGRGRGVHMSTVEAGCVLMLRPLLCTSPLTYSPQFALQCNCCSRLCASRNPCALRAPVAVRPMRAAGSPPRTTAAARGAAAPGPVASVIVAARPRDAPGQRWGGFDGWWRAADGMPAFKAQPPLKAGVVHFPIEERWLIAAESVAVQARIVGRHGISPQLR
jgi:hypothetical protein